MKQVRHPRYQRISRALVCANVIAVFASLFGMTSLDYSPVTDAVLASISIMVVCGAFLFALTHLSYLAKGEIKRVQTLPMLRLGEFYLLKKLNLPCTVHWLRDNPHVEFAEIDDAILFKLAKPPKERKPDVS